MEEAEDRESPATLSRVAVPEIDAMLGHAHKVLDDGFVRVIDYLGGDQSIVQAARVSYGSGTRRVREDGALVRFLLRHRHTTPFEMCEIKLHVRVPMDTWRQWIRHRTANVNEYSTRYSIAINRSQQTDPSEWRVQSTANRQGSSGFVDPAVGKTLTERETQLHDASRKTYDERLELGVAREQARKDLPLSTYTEAYWKIDLWNLLHFLGLRMAPEAQSEIRAYARVIGDVIVARWVPVAWNAFLDYHYNALHLSALEVRVLRHLLVGNRDAAREELRLLGWLDHSDSGQLKKNREREEFLSKLNSRLGMPTEWLL